MGTVMNESRRQILLDTPHTETATGAIATFETDMVGRAKEVKVEIEPVQDLHGYDHPWPAGGGVNKLASNATKDVTVIGQQTIVFSLTKNVAEITIDKDLTASLGYRFNDGSIEAVLPAGNYFFSTNITNQQVGSGLFIFDATTATILGRARAEGGASISLSAETTVRLGVSLSATTKAGTYWFQLESGSTATSFAPYSNICPITGWNGVNVQRTGGNLLPTFATAPTVSGLTLAVNNGKITINGTVAATTTIAAPVGVFVWDGVQDMWLSGCPAGGNYQGGYSLRIDGPGSGDYSAPDTGSGVKLVGYSASNHIDGRPIKFQIVLRPGTYTDITFAPMLNFGNSASPYEEYKGVQTTPISWADEAGTVYGGYLEWLWDGTVKLTKTHEMKTPTKINNQVSAYATISIGPFGYVANDWEMSNMLRAWEGTASQIPEGCFNVFNSNGYNRAQAIIKIAGLSTASEYNGYLQSLADAGTPLQICYELATPVTYTLTPQQALVFLRGTNNVWNDINDTTVTYWTHKTGDSV